MHELSECGSAMAVAAADAHNTCVVVASDAGHCASGCEAQGLGLATARCAITTITVQVPSSQPLSDKPGQHLFSAHLKSREL